LLPPFTDMYALPCLVWLFEVVFTVTICCFMVAGVLCGY
jgi:hypothetical protein